MNNQHTDSIIISLKDAGTVPTEFSIENWLAINSVPIPNNDIPSPLSPLSALGTDSSSMFLDGLCNFSFMNAGPTSAGLGSAGLFTGASASSPLSPSVDSSFNFMNLAPQNLNVAQLQSQQVQRFGNVPGMPPKHSEASTGRQFSDPENLVINGGSSSASRTGIEKPHVCMECGTSFKRRHDLRRHQRKHSSIALFQCSDCGKGFSRSDTLSQHRDGMFGCRSMNDGRKRRRSSKLNL